jgi:transglutaminase-like putative cysteine protease
VRQRADDIAGDEETPYDKAVAIERWLEENKRYSLAVERPGGDIADSFLFEMDAGYCTYYATTMVVLLRSQGVPARFVTGYTPGEIGDDGSYVVRGLDSHAWVEVYFPDVGWIRFDPTPSSPRESAERARLAEARQNEEPGVDTDDTEPTPTPTPASPDAGTANETANATAEARPPSFGQSRTPQPGLVAPEEGDTDRGVGGFVPELPSRRSLVLAAVALLGLVAGARRTGVARWSYRTAQMWFQGRQDSPDADAERAFVRLERLLERRYRPRRRDETPRQYLDSLSHRGLDERARDVLRTYELAHYRGSVSREQADRAVAQVSALVREGTPVVGRLFASGRRASRGDRGRN